MITTAVHSHTHTAASPLPTKTVIAEIASRTLKEMAVSITLASIVSCFVASVNVPILFQACAIQCVASLIFRTAKAITKSELFEWANSINFALFTGYNTQVLIHEMGHALSAMAVYARTTPQIILTPFGSAATLFSKGSLSTFGKKIGAPAATCLIVASGPALTLFVSAALFSIGLSVKTRYPELSKHLICWALLDFFSTAHYAYTAIGNTSFNFAHDFVHLSVFGLSPAVATISIAAIPVITATAFYFSK